MIDADLFRKAFDVSSVAMMMTAADGTILAVNAAFTAVTGWRRDEVLGANPRILNSGRQSVAFYREMWRSLTERGRWQGEIWNRRKSGQVFPEHLVIDAIVGNDGRATQYICSFADISAGKSDEEQLFQLAYHDRVTGLPNRALFEDRLHQALALARRRSEYLAVAFMDLDGFKTVNDSHGHEIGDRLLRAVGRAIAETLRSSDTAARFGGDEFGVLLPAVDGPSAAGWAATRLLAAVTQPFDVGPAKISVGVSIGIGLFPDHADDADSLIRCADQAMYAVKRTGKGAWRLWGATATAAA